MTPEEEQERVRRLKENARRQIEEWNKNGWPDEQYNEAKVRIRNLKESKAMMKRNYEELLKTAGADPRVIKFYVNMLKGKSPEYLEERKREIQEKLNLRLPAVDKPDESKPLDESDPLLQRNAIKI